MVKEEHATPPPPSLTSFLALSAGPWRPLPSVHSWDLRPFLSRGERTQPALPAQTDTPLLMCKNSSYPRATCCISFHLFIISDFSPFLFPALLTHILSLTHTLLTHLVCIRPSVLHFSGPFWVLLSWLSKLPPTNPVNILHCRGYWHTHESTGVKPWHSAHWSSYKTLNWSVAKTLSCDG